MQKLAIEAQNKAKEENIDIGDLEAAGIGLATAVTAAGDATAVAAKGLGEGAKTAAEGVGNMFSSMTMIIVVMIIACLVGLYLFLK